MQGLKIDFFAFSTFPKMQSWLEARPRFFVQL